MSDADHLIGIFHEAKARPAGVERERFLAGICCGDPQLREQIDSLLQADEAAGDFLKSTASSTPGAAREGPGESVGRYKLRETLGEGGCGVVYVADQEEPVRRRVALKVIKLGMDTRQVVARFEAERQALALMDHPNIARVLDAGTTDSGRPFFVMELVRGIRITDYCNQANLTTKERIGLFLKVCHAIQHAHQKGIIHRDVKPSNILVTLHDGVPVPKVIDFGIAKATEGRLTDATVYTQFHHFIGTPAYMSPEQAEMNGLDIDTRSDIYSLGVLLYELLTGNTPFDGQKLMASGLDAMRKTIREMEPERPSTRLTRELTAVRQIEPTPRRDASELAIPSEAEATADSRRCLRLREQINRVRGDLDWIVMRCLEKDRSRRYDTANGLAADLQRHLDNQPVVARPPTSVYRFHKMVRRNKLVFAVTGVVVTALIAGMLLALWWAIRAKDAQQATRRSAYAAEINVAFHALAENNLRQARELLDRQRPRSGEVDLRGFEWRHLWWLCRGDELATFHDEGAMAIAFSPDGKLLAYSDRRIIVRAVESHKIVTILPGPAGTLSFAPHTNLLASGNNSGVKIWNTGTWTEVRSLPGTNHTARFSPDGQWLLTATAEGYRIWDTRTWQPAATCSGLPRLTWNSRNAVAFSPDGQFLITSAAEDSPAGDRLCLWRLPGLEELAPVPFEGELPGSVAFSRDGNKLLIGLWDGRLAVRDFAGQKVAAERMEHSSWITEIAMSQDGAVFVTSSADQTVRLWDADTFRPLVRLRGHVGPVWSIASSPDGRIVASGSADGTTKLWSADTRTTNDLSVGASVIAGFIDGGRRVVAATNSHWCVWTPENGVFTRLPISTGPQFVTDSSGVPGQHYAVKPGEPLAVLGRHDGRIEVWDLTGGAMVTGWAAHGEGISTLAFSSDGRLLATASATGEVKVWNFASQRETSRFGPVGELLLCLAFSPNGETLAASGESSSIRLWNLGTRQEMTLKGQGNHVASVAFSPDGRLLATTALNFNGALLWELPSGRLVGALQGHVMGTTAVAFSPDGKTLATGSLDRRLKLWNVATRHELATFALANRYPTIRFSPDSPDSRLLVTGSGIESAGKVLEILRAPSFEEIAEAEAEENRTPAGTPAR